MKYDMILKELKWDKSTFISVFLTFLQIFSLDEINKMYALYVYILNFCKMYIYFLQYRSRFRLSYKIHAKN